MTPDQLEPSANAPWMRTTVGLPLTGDGVACAMNDPRGDAATVEPVPIEPTPPASNAADPARRRAVRREICRLRTPAKWLDDIVFTTIPLGVMSGKIVATRPDTRC